MSRIGHVAVEAPDPDATAAFYERVFDARVVRTEGHPVMAYMGPTAVAVHKPGGAGPHTAIRVSAEEQARLRTTLDELGLEWTEPSYRIVTPPDRSRPLRR
jgi:catechol 2,3-dioxygenase-like lactoylglutathione lyase family enzyme